MNPIGHGSQVASEVLVSGVHVRPVHESVAHVSTPRHVPPSSVKKSLHVVHIAEFMVSTHRRFWVSHIWKIEF
jgi:hypothetical protein